MNAEIIALIIRKRRDALGYSQKELAEKSGVHLRSINNIESGKGNPSLDTLLKIVEVLRLELLVRIP
ncbi:MAG: helix-turn-helix transcriptional regulator [Bacteroidia bacterium]|nr:helix-turn-helix transcriptional regulator [Bacteroidia bacterium]MCC7533691.1 helix-turn-helix transcriptional regulator [Bacteroidia bacterium]